MFLDFEGHPFWHADAELFFLFGLIEQSSAGDWEFKAFWAHDKAEEAVATQALIDHLAEPSSCSSPTCTCTTTTTPNGRRWSGW